MTITPDVDRAIVAVVDATGEVLGTGFMIGSRGAILTAKHVVAGHQAMQVGFLDHTASPSDFPHFDFVDAALVRETPDSDGWAILRVTTPERIPTGVTPVMWSPLGDRANVEWASIGHIPRRRPIRSGFHGKIVVAATMQLFCDQLHQGFEDDAKGLSGAPCIVDGEAVALITHVLSRRAKQRSANGGGGRARSTVRHEPVGSHDSCGNPIVAAQVTAIPLQAIFAQIRQLGFDRDEPFPDETSDLPWQADFTDAIEELSDTMQSEAAAQMLIPHPVKGSRRLPRRIAREMIRRGVWGTWSVVERVALGFRDPRRPGALMRQAKTLWVNKDAAAHFAKIAITPAVGLLETDWQESAEQHFLRAEEHHRRMRDAAAVGEPGANGWCYVMVHEVHQEPFVDSVIACIRNKIGAQRGHRRMSPRFASKRVVVFVHGSPRDDLVSALRAEWPQLVVIFFARRPSSHDNASVICVRPAPDPNDERQALEDSEELQRLLPQARSAS